MEMHSVGSPALWSIFALIVLGILALDLIYFHRRAREIPFREAVFWCVFWIFLATIFNIGIYAALGAEPALEFFTGYLIELSLSVDNIFVFLVIFTYFKVPAAYQHRVLFYGILGAIVMRGIFVAAGAALIQHFHAMIYVFGGILILSGLRLLTQKIEQLNPEKNILVRLFQRAVPMTGEFHAEKFFIRENGKLLATPLCLVLVAVEVTDLVFAVDSVPAIFAITTDPFIVYTSNIFAILGLRAIYLVLAGSMKELVYLKVGLSLVLIFVGVKMAIMDFYKIPTVWSLLTITVLIGGSVMASILHKPAEDLHEPEEKS